ncbi:MAG TPA: hypothetical protein PKK07_02825, partial [bacterium]|nr:hypothetical protein [bacterium]
DPRDLFENVENKVYPVIKNDKEITALGELEKNPYSQDTYWVKFLFSKRYFIILSFIRLILQT